MDLHIASIFSSVGSNTYAPPSTMARKFRYPMSLTQLAIVVAAAWMCVLPPCSSAGATTTAAASQQNLPVPSAASMAPVGSTVPASIAASPVTATAPEKFALPNPADLGFGGGYGGQTVPGGGLGGFNGYNEGFGGCCGGFGYNGFGGNGGIGYDNGPLFFGSAQATRLRLRNMVVENGFAPLLVAGVAAMFYV